jgi:predicted SAM-dependent methyltransferase
MPAMRLFRRAPPVPAGPVRLHVGSGSESLPGWVNIDSRALPGVDRVLDVRRGLPFRDVASIYAEHFLEHLSLDEGLAFLAECRRALADAGVLRLSTPNLDWVYATHYRPQSWAGEVDALRDCMQMNRAFRGWGHQFLYNRQTLTAALKAAGLANLVFCRYGASERPELAGLERHETWQDSLELPHVLIVEASGRAAPVALPATELDEYRRDVGIR